MFSFQLTHVFKVDLLKSVLAVLLNPVNPKRMLVNFSGERTPNEVGKVLTA